MIIDAQEGNEQVKANSFELEELKAALPQYFDGEGNFKFDSFQKMLGDQEIQFSKESYELNFLGKSYGKYLAGLSTETVLVPDVEHNERDENKDSENLYITGDNLDALKHLKKSYKGAFKCIYIDPPYNTGKGDFAYVDDFGFTVEDLMEKVGLTELEAERVLELHGKASHSAWLTFMLPRLMIAKTLLNKDGFIIVSIDDNEQANLKLILDDIFGENNLVAQIIRKGTGGKQDSSHLAKVHEYALMYAKDESNARAGKDTVGERKYPHADPDGRKYRTQLLRKWGDNDRREDREKLYYAIPAPDGSDLFPLRPDGSDGRWRWKKDTTMKRALENNEIHFAQDGDGVWTAHQKIYEDNDSSAKTFNTWIDKSNDLKEDKLQSLYSDPKPFKYPKPVGLLVQLFERAGVEDGDLVLDFFSGSASSAHAILRMNATDGGSREIISVQIGAVLDEDDPGRKHDFETIDEIGRDRIKRAAAKIKEETGAEIDYGFKHFKLETPEDNPLDNLKEFVDSDDLFSDNPLDRFDFGQATAREVLLTTWINQDGYGLLAKPETITLDTYNLEVVGSTAYALDEGMTTKDVIELVRLLESNELKITQFVYFTTALEFHTLTEVKNSFKQLRNDRSITLTARW